MGANTSSFRRNRNAVVENIAQRTAMARSGQKVWVDAELKILALLKRSSSPVRCVVKNVAFTLYFGTDFGA